LFVWNTWEFCQQSIAWHQQIHGLQTHTVCCSCCYCCCFCLFNDCFSRFLFLLLLLKSSATFWQSLFQLCCLFFIYIFCALFFFHFFVCYAFTFLGSVLFMIFFCFFYFLHKFSFWLLAKLSNNFLHC